MNRSTMIAATAVCAPTAVMLCYSLQWPMRSNLLQQPHSTKTTITGSVPVGAVTVTGGEATLVGATGEATTSGGNRWNV